MEQTNILSQLRTLDGHERLGRAYFEQTGKPLSFFVLSYLAAHQALGPDLINLNTPAAQAALARGQTLFGQTYEQAGLSEEDFIPQGINVELEKLPRYVDIVAHKHGFFEVVCVLEGACRHTIEKQEFWLGPGDITVIPPQLAHHLQAEPNCICITIKVRKSTFEQAFSSLLQERSVLSAYFTQNLYTPAVRSALTFHCPGDGFLREQLLYMFAQQAGGLPYCHNIIEGLLAVLFSYLLQNHQDSLEFSHPVTQHQQRMAEILGYLRTHYQTATLSSTAALFYLSPAYLSASIRRFTGHTFSEIVRAYRLQRAAELLCQSSLKLEQVCEAVGYHDPTQFVRSFKAAYGCTPMRYRKQNAQKD